MSATVGAAWREVRDKFRAAGIETPERDARLLAEAAFGLSGLDLTTAEGSKPDPGAIARLMAFEARRLRGEPVARIVGHKGFWGRDFIVSPATLVPRPETELLVETALAAIAGRTEPHVLDLGTGTGCIAISILGDRPDAAATAVDISDAALATAAENADRHGVAPRLTLVRGSWFSALPAPARFDLIASNPPYIELAEVETLAPEVREHDPLLALSGGADGLEAYRAILEDASRWLRPHGALLLEIGSRQAAAVSGLCHAAGFSEVRTLVDLAGLDRVIVASGAPSA